MNVIDKQKKKQNDERISVLIRKRCFWCGIICFVSGILLALESYNIISLFQSVRLIIYTTVIVALPVQLFTCASNFWLPERIKQRIEEQSIADKEYYDL